MATRLFADISDNNGGAIDFKRYRAAGHLLIGIKATEGFDRDPTYVSRVHQAHQAGLIVWHYLFAHPDNHPSANGAEAVVFWETVQPHFVKGDQLVIDLEIAHPSGPATCGRYLHALDAAIHRRSGHWPLGYSFESFINSELGGQNVHSRQWWPAAFRDSWPRLPRGFKTYARQRADGKNGPLPHSLPGIPGVCDVSELTRFRYAQLLFSKRRGGRK